jgi:hypothetical protein
MNHFSMTDRNEKPPGRMSKQSRTTDAAFDVWLNRGLHELFDDVVKEPVPPELLKIIDADRKKSRKDYKEK